jgi:lysophospholipase L1-like esterase
MKTMIHRIHGKKEILFAIMGVTLVTVTGSEGEAPRKDGYSSHSTISVQSEKKIWTFVALDDANFNYAPYVWKRSGSGRAARAEAAMPGAYIKAAFQGSAAVRVLIDGTANDGCPAPAMPVVDYSLDQGAFKTVQLAQTGKVYSLTLGEGLDGGAAHRLEFYFRAAGLGPKRWEASTVHLRIAGFELESGGSFRPCPAKPKRAIGFGDSITEGVCAEGLCPYYSNLLMNNARVTWFPILCNALNCEYGQLGSGGQGMVTTTMALPPLPRTWDRHDPSASRLTKGRLVPEPDYVFCAMGTNDYRADKSLLPIADAYSRWLESVRQACPNARIFCIVPPLGWQAAEIAEAVAVRNKSGDGRVFLIDTAPLQSSFGTDGATQLAPDGVHPSVFGNAMLGALIAVKVQKILNCP